MYMKLESYKLESRYFDTVSRRIHLDDGRIATCRIPLIGEEEVVMH